MTKDELNNDRIEYGKFLSKQIDALESFLKKPYDTLVNTFIIKGLEDECSQIDMESREFILSKYREMLERLKQKFEAL